VQQSQCRAYRGPTQPTRSSTPTIPNEIAESAEQPLAAMTASVSSLTNLNKDGLMMVDISKLTTVKILDKRSNASGVAYECALEPLWLAVEIQRDHSPLISDIVPPALDIMYTSSDW
jgi:hypothetical protein